MPKTIKDPASHRRLPVLAENMVATSQPLASRAGLDMLRQGGNAVDAALAAAITLTVVEPTGCGLGSDAFAIIWDGQKLHGLNGSGKSPAGWSPAHFSIYDSMPELGWDTVTVPGAVHAWATLSRRFGVLPFAKLFGPAIHCAKNGFSVTPKIASLWSEAPKRYREYPDFADMFLPGGRAPLIGERFKPPYLAATLAELAKTDGESFYKGKIAEKITNHAAATGGILNMADLTSHRSRWVTPISQTYGNITLHEIPPNGQGLAALIALGLLQHHDLKSVPSDSADSIHLQVEAMKIAFAEAHHHIADQAVMAIRPERFLETPFLKKRAGEIDMDRAKYPKSLIFHEKGTVCLATADAKGMMVSFIQSNYFGFGSGIVIPGTGISLQNRGCGFTLEKGHPNRVDGAKRPYHTIIPAIVTKDKQAILSFGVMGAHMQPQGHVQMITRMFDYGFDPQKACDAPRWCITENGELALEPGIGESIVVDLAARGHAILPRPPRKIFGGAQMIEKVGKGYRAASDHRKDGQAVGF